MEENTSITNKMWFKSSTVIIYYYVFISFSVQLQWPKQRPQGSKAIVRFVHDRFGLIADCWWWWNTPEISFFHWNKTYDCQRYENIESNCLSRTLNSCRIENYFYLSVLAITLSNTSLSHAVLPCPCHPPVTLTMRRKPFILCCLEQTPVVNCFNTL